MHSRNNWKGQGILDWAIFDKAKMINCVIILAKAQAMLKFRFKIYWTSFKEEKPDFLSLLNKENTFHAKHCSWG